MSKLVPITRIGWREAVKMIQDEGWKLSVQPDGHAELLSPPERVPSGRYTSFTMSGCAYHYLTERSVELLRKKL